MEHSSFNTQSPALEHPSTSGGTQAPLWAFKHIPRKTKHLLMISDISPWFVKGESWVHLPGATSSVPWEPQHLSEPLKDLPSIIPRKPSIPLELQSMSSGHVPCISPAEPWRRQGFLWTHKALPRLSKNHPGASWNLPGATKEIIWESKHLSEFTLASPLSTHTFRKHKDLLW